MVVVTVLSAQVAEGGGASLYTHANGRNNATHNNAVLGGVEASRNGFDWTLSRELTVPDSDRGERLTRMVVIFEQDG